jgi:hypothetical protein
MLAAHFEAVVHGLMQADLMAVQAFPNALLHLLADLLLFVPHCLHSFLSFITQLI